MGLDFYRGKLYIYYRLYMNSKYSSKDFACTHRKYLPCPFSYPAEEGSEVYHCSYHRIWVIAKWIKGDDELAIEATNHACLPIRKEIEFEKNLADLHKEYAKDIVSTAKIGDKVFCFDETDGVVELLEKPEIDTGNCVYRDSKGLIKAKPIMLFRTISQGNYCVEHTLPEGNGEIESLMIKRMALEAGFRVEIKKSENKYFVKVFGDSQQEVDEFFTLCVHNKHILY